jgi:DNA-binding NtrC family response regulator
MIEQLQQYLSTNVIFQLYLEAEERIGDSPASESVAHLRSVSRLAIGAAQRALGMTTEDFFTGNTLKEEVRRYEAELIRRAMDEANGHITRAARILGITHQALCEKLNSRHQGLRLKPARVRQRSPQQATDYTDSTD